MTAGPGPKTVDADAGAMPRGEPARAWHALEPADALSALETAPSGLANEEAATRLATFGPTDFVGVAPN